MTDRQRLIPDERHPIAIAPADRRIRVFLGARLIAETSNAVVLREATYPAVHYIPRSDIDTAVLTPSAHVTFCPYKGEANYHGLRGEDGVVLADKVWYYAHPADAVASIADHLAFYPDAVRIETVES